MCRWIYSFSSSRSFIIDAYFIVIHFLSQSEFIFSLTVNVLNEMLRYTAYKVNMYLLIYLVIRTFFYFNSLGRYKLIDTVWDTYWAMNMKCIAQGNNGLPITGFVQIGLVRRVNDSARRHHDVALALNAI